MSRRSRGDEEAAGATATAAPTPATTLDDTSSGGGALAATLASAGGDGPDLVGKTIDRYRVTGRLGAGGMGVVYAALDPALDRKVALKVLPTTARDREQHLEVRLRREAQALARLDHPNVVRVYDVGVAEHSVFVAMQLVDGMTVAEWLETKPAPKEILAAFVDAARGLAAAHDAGIVHRDVKPSNILLDRQGRAYVGDFGLARGAGDAPDDAGPGVTTTSENLLDEQMTREGSVLGTPLFMSPEQHQGQQATPRSDQFSFCVSLWQALFDTHPFVARWVLAAAIDAMARDAVREPASTRGVPARVIRALRRGMRHDPNARWPSMEDLIDELAPRSRAPWIAAGLAFAGIVGGAGVALAVSGGAGDPCANAGARLSETWGASTAAQLREAFAKTGLPYASNVTEQVVKRFDSYGRSWSAMRVEACRANRDGEQSDNTLDQRMRCLDRRLAELAAQVQLLTHAPTGDIVDDAPRLVGGLPAIDDCAAKNVQMVVERPRSPTQKSEIAKLDEEIARARTAIDAATDADPIRTADALLARARAIDDGVVLARALDIAADARMLTSDLDGALARWREAASAATRAHDDITAVRAMHAIASTLASAGKADQSLVAIEDADVVGARAEIPPDLQADLLVARATALTDLNRYPEGDAAYAKAIAIEEQAQGKDSWQVAESLVGWSRLQNEVGRYDDAVAGLTRALPILEQQLGAQHPHVAIAHQNLGNAYLYQGKNELARKELEQALLIKRTRYPAGSASVAFTLQSLAIVDLDMGDLTAADRGFQEAYDLRVKALGADHPETLSSLYELGVVRRQQGRYAEARDILGRVLTGRIRHFGEDHTSVANVLDAIANVDLMDDKLDDATAARKRSLAIREKLLGPYADDVTISLLGLAEIAVGRDRCDQAQPYLDRTLAIQEHNHAPWFDRIEGLGLAAMCESRPASLAALRAQLEPIVAKALAGAELERKADAQFALGLVIYKQGERAKGNALVVKARDLYRDAKQVDAAKPMEEWLAKHPR